MIDPKKLNQFSFFYNLIQLGIVSENQSLKEKKRIVLFNTSCLVWYAIVFILITGYLLNNPVNYINITVHLLLMSLVIIGQVFHAKQYFNTGRILFLCSLILIGLLFGNYFRPGNFIEFYLLLVPGISLLYFDKRCINNIIFIVSFVCFAIPNIFFQNYPNVNLYQPSLICLFFSVYLLVNYFKKLNEKNEKLLALERDKVFSDKIILEQQEAKLRELNQFKTHFFVNLSHEIRTPITLIKGYTSKINFNQPIQDNEYKLEIVNHQIKQIEDILNSILDLSKLDENKLKLNTSEIALMPFISKHYAEFKNLFEKKNIAFKLHNTTDMIAVKIDNSLFSKAINNLLNNALKFTEKAGNVHINIFQENDLFIQVVDNGIGIPKKDLDKVFERFYQSENEITKSQGSGIGLSFTKSIIETHGFDISVKSKPNIKTVFTITIPEKYITTKKEVYQASLPIVKSTSYQVPVLDNELPTKSETILIVDDHTELRHYLKTVLKPYHILEAENGKKALEIIKEKSIDLILTDYMMPEMNGKELTIEIKKLDVKIPIIMLTARVDDVAKLDMLRIGLDNYLIKPFIEEELLLTIEKSIKVYKNIEKNLKELSTEERKELDEIGITFYKNIGKVINENVSNFNFGVEDIAFFFNISKRTLNRRAKSILGQTVKELIMKTRLEKARELQLKNPDMSKKEIANTVGINNAGYLFKQLAETYGQRFQKN